MPAVLGYWNVRGLGEVIRLMLEYLGVQYEDKRYNFGKTPETYKAEWLQDKDKLGLIFPNLPYFIDGDVRISQSLAIVRYLARKHNLLGATEKDQIRTDMVEQQCIDFRAAIAHLAYGQNFEQNLPQFLATLPDALRPFDAVLGGKYDWFGGSQISFVDFLMYTVLHTYRCLAPEIVNSFEHLKAFMQRFEALPRVSEYLKSDRFRNSPIHGAVASWGNVPLN